MTSSTRRAGAKPSDADDEVAAQAVAEADDINDVTVIDGEAVEIVEATVDEAEALVEAEGTQELVLHERAQAPAPTTVLPSPGEWEATMTMARTIAGTPFVPVAYRGQPEAVVAAILYGREIGLGPMQALQKIHMIDGKPSLSADLMLAQMRRGGLVILSSESTGEHAVIHARRNDTGEEATVEWTLAEARTIPAKERGQNIMLADKGTWRAYPADMLWARCVGRLARRLGSDLLGGVALYSSEEMQDWDEGGYGGSGYDTPAQQPQRGPETSGGVELRADAPRGWPAIMDALNGIDGGIDWQTWVLQAASAVVDVNLTTLREVPEDRYRDCIILIGNGVANLVEALSGRDFPPPNRDEIRSAFSRENAVGVKLDGPAQPLDPQEASQEAAESHGDDDATDEPNDGPEALSAPQDAEDGHDGGDAQP